MIFKDEDLVDQQLQIVSLQLVLFQNVAEHVDGGLGHAVDLNDGVALVGQQVDLVVDAVDLLLEVCFHLVIQRLDGDFLLRLFHDLPDALALRDLQLLGEVGQHLGEVVLRLLRFRHLLGLPLQLLVELRQHGGGAVRQLAHIVFQQLVQPVNADMMTGAALEAAPVIRPAGVGGGQIAAAHGEHGAAAVSAHQKARIHIVVLFYPPVVGGGSLFPQYPGGCKGTVVDDGLVVVFNDDLLVLILPDILAVDFFAGVLPLAQGADVKVVVQDALHRHNRPDRPDRPVILLSGGLLPVPLRHARGGDALVGEVVGNLFIAPALLVVETEDGTHDVRLGGDDFKLLPLVKGISIGRGADPLSVSLPPLDDILHLFAGVGDGHLVDEKLKLDFQPVVVVGEINAVPDGDNPHPGVPQVLQLHQSPAVAPGEAGEVLDNEDVVLVAYQPLPHGLVALPLLKGVAGAVPVLIEGEGAVGEFLFDKVLDDGLLVFDGHIIPIQLIVHRNAGITGNGK